jgi:hypothetical protein
LVKQKLAKVIRVITVAPIMALILLLVLFFTKEEFFGNSINLILAILFLAVFPILGYPLQPLIPYYKKKGREWQRDLAMWTSITGYVLGVVSAAIMPVSSYLMIIYLTYLISGVSLVLLNKVFKIRASGHACGVAGPIFSLIYFLGPWVLFGVLILAAVYWASLKMNRHNGSELLIGTSIPTYALLLAFLMVIGFHN